MPTVLAATRVGSKMIDPEIPIGRIIRLVSKAIRYSKGGFTREERRDLIAALLSLAADIADEDELLPVLPFTQPGPETE